MSNKITVITQPKNRISINTTQRTQVKSVNLVGATTTGAAVDTLIELKDVDATSVDNNETIVYDEVSGKFVVKEIPIINGGTF
jgi:hypothetical protein